MTIHPWKWLDRENAKKGLEELSDILTEYGVAHWLQYGTLVGAIRENTFLVHDYDVDLGIYHEGFKKLSGIKHELGQKHGILLSGNSVISDMIPNNARIPAMICISLYNVKFDLYVFYIKDDKSRRLIDVKNEKFCVWESSANHHAVLDKINFLGKEYNIPSNAEEYLTETYGDWRTPRFGTVNDSHHKYYDKISDILTIDILNEYNIKENE